MRAHPQHSSMTTLRRQFAGALLALFMAAFAGAGLAAGLGPINPQSRIGQPFAADIDLINVGRDDFMALKVGLASAASYRAAGLTLDPVLNSLRLTLERRANGAPYIRAITTRRVTEPYLDVLVELSTPDGGYSVPTPCCWICQIPRKPPSQQRLPRPPPCQQQSRMPPRQRKPRLGRSAHARLCRRPPPLGQRRFLPHPPQPLRPPHVHPRQQARQLRQHHRAKSHQGGSQAPSHPRNRARLRRHRRPQHPRPLNQPHRRQQCRQRPWLTRHRLQHLSLIHI